MALHALESAPELAELPKAWLEIFGLCWAVALCHQTCSFVLSLRLGHRGEVWDCVAFRGCIARGTISSKASDAYVAGRQRAIEQHVRHRTPPARHEWTQAQWVGAEDSPGCSISFRQGKQHSNLPLSTVTHQLPAENHTTRSRFALLRHRCPHICPELPLGLRAAESPEGR